MLKPATLLKFHKALVDRKYRLLFSSSAHRRKPGPKGPSPEVIAAIVEMKIRNPKFGYLRIAQQISHAFGIDIEKDVVRRVLAKHYRPDNSDSHGPSWLSFLAHNKDSLWSLDLFRCESIRLRSHWVILVMDIFTRRIIGFGVERASIDGVSVCRMFNYATAGEPMPARISTDHDPCFVYTAGSPTYACLKLRRSSRSRMRQSRIRSLSASSVRSDVSISIACSFGTLSTSTGSWIISGSTTTLIASIAPLAESLQLNAPANPRSRPPNSLRTRGNSIVAVSLRHQCGDEY